MIIGFWWKRAVRFLVSIKEQLESPERLLLNYRKRKFMFDVVVIGGGPAGYVAAIRSSQLGWKLPVLKSIQIQK